VRSHDQYCPVAKAAEALGDKWSLLMVRELLHGVNRFNQFERSLPGISRSVLAQRLRQLERAGVVQRRADPDGRTVEYHLTDAGRELHEVVQALGNWAARWILDDPRPSELDPDLLMLWISRHMHRDRLPSRRVVIEFALGSSNRHHYWLVLQTDEVSLCLKHPGFDPDLLVTADVAALYQVYLGRFSLADALHDDLLQVDGPPRWYESSPDGSPGAASPRLPGLPPQPRIGEVHRGTRTTKTPSRRLYTH
jgi:DNA-binding HxlR family transcriptional regulator